MQLDGTLMSGPRTRMDWTDDTNISMMAYLMKYQGTPRSQWMIRWLRSTLPNNPDREIQLLSSVNRGQISILSNIPSDKAFYASLLRGRPGFRGLA
jgi:hypothetical protein